MEVYNLILIISAILPPSVVLKKNVSKCLRAKKVMDIGLLIPATLPQKTTEVIKVVDISLLIPDTLPQVIADIVDLGQVLPATIPIVIA